MFPGSIPGEDLIFSWYTIAVALCLGVIIGLRNYMRGPQCMSREDIEKRTMIITGGNGSVAIEIAVDMAKRGARVILACRDEEKGKAALEEVTERAKSKRVYYMKLDLSSLQSVRDFVKEFKKSNKKLHYLVNAASVMYQPEGESADGFEIHFAINYLGHFLLTYLLLDMLKASAPGRIVNFTCPAYALCEQPDPDALSEKKLPTEAPAAFAHSKLMVMLFNIQLAKLLEGTNVTSNVIHPGICKTGIYRNMPLMQSKVIRYTFAPMLWFVMKSGKDGAQTALQCLVAKEEEGVSGKFYKDCMVTKTEHPLLEDAEAAELVWRITARFVGVAIVDDDKKTDSS